MISEQGIGWPNTPGIYTEEMVAGWRRITNRIQATGTPLVLQLWHCGRVSHSDFLGGELPVSASAVKLRGDSIRTPRGKKAYEAPRALSVGEIQATVDDYRQAAANARWAGFSGVEIHGANGYLVNQFLDSRSNRREDQYGGSAENRFRFLREVVQAVLGSWPAARVGVRLSPNGVFNDMGHDGYRETFLHAAEELGSLEVGYLHIMDGLAFGFHERGEPMSLAEFRKVYPGMIIGNCGYTKESAEEMIAAGHADMIAFGRPFITNPDLPERFKNDWPLEPAEDMSLWYSAGAEGYTSYPPYGSSPPE